MSNMLSAIYVNERDVATYVIKAVDDPRTINRILYVTPRENIYSLNQLVALWEKKIGKALERNYVTEEELLAKISSENSHVSDKSKVKFLILQLEIYSKV